MELTSKVAYLKGLIDGLDFDKTTNEGKIIMAIVDVLDELSLTVEDVAAEVDETVELIDTLDEDLGAVEEALDELDVPPYGPMHGPGPGDDEDMDDVQYECVCPTCGDTICLDESLVEQGSIDCPNCGESLEFDFDDSDK